MVIMNRNRPYRDRAGAYNLDLFRRMRAGEFDEGACVLRAKIDMASPNMVMRDPVLSRILKAPHHRTGEQWVIYPTVSYTHLRAHETVLDLVCRLLLEKTKLHYLLFLSFPRSFTFNFSSSVHSTLC